MSLHEKLVNNSKEDNTCQVLSRAVGYHTYCTAETPALDCVL